MPEVFTGATPITDDQNSCRWWNKMEKAKRSRARIAPTFPRIDGDLWLLAVFEAGTPVGDDGNRKIFTQTQTAGDTTIQRTIVVYAPDYGVPDTGDRPLFLRFQSFFGEAHRRGDTKGQIIEFRDSDFLNFCGIENPSDDEYAKIDRFLHRIYDTRIILKEVTPCKGGRTIVETCAAIFDRLTTKGTYTDGHGIGARDRLVKLSDWLFENTLSKCTNRK